MASPDPRAKTVRELAQRLKKMQPVEARERVSSGIAALDQLLPAGGFHQGALIEWLADGEGSGAGALALKQARQAMQTGGALVVVDHQREFYPPAAWGLEIDLERAIVVRPDNSADAIWALEQSLRSGGVAASLCWIDRLQDRVFRRLQLAAETGGGLGLLIRPSRAQAEPSWAEARLLVQPLPALSVSSGRRLQIKLLSCRGGTSGGAVEVEISHETGDVRVASQLADPTPLRRAAGA